jgi:hypothetical protein
MSYIPKHGISVHNLHGNTCIPKCNSLHIYVMTLFSIVGRVGRWKWHCCFSCGLNSCGSNGRRCGSVWGIGMDKALFCRCTCSRFGNASFGELEGFSVLTFCVHRDRNHQNCILFLFEGPMNKIPFCIFPFWSFIR